MINESAGAAMAEPEPANSTTDQKTDSAAGPSGDAALKAIAHLQQVAETLAADAAKLADDAPTKAESADAKTERRIFLPALAEEKVEAPPKPEPAAAAPDWRARLNKRFGEVVWAQTAAAAVLTIAVAGGAYLGLMDYLDRKEAQRLAAEDALRHPVETLAERELRGKIAELALELQSMRAQMGKIAGEARAAHTQATTAAAAAQAVARVEKTEKELAGKIDQQLVRVERLERLAADPIVTSSIAKDKQAGQSVAAQTPARQGLRTPDPSMKPNTFVLRSVRNGVAMVQTRRGMLEVGPGDIIPGVGRVRSIRRMDGRWVVVMHDGYIDQDDE